MNKPKLHPLVAGLFEAIAETAVKQVQVREAAKKRAMVMPRVVQRRNDTANKNRIAKTLVTPRQLKKMQKAARREPQS